VSGLDIEGSALTEVLARAMHATWCEDAAQHLWSADEWAAAEGLAAAVRDHLASVLGDAGVWERVAANLRAVGFWATHSDRWNDADWQAELWATLAKSALEPVREALGGEGS